MNVLNPTQAITLALAVGCGLSAPAGPAGAQGGDRRNPPVDLAIAPSFEVPAADAKTRAIVAAAQAFLGTLDPAQRAAAVFPFDDNAQRANWSNFPHPTVPRQGVMRGNMTDAQLAALDRLLSEVMSAEGVRNIVLQLAADEASDTGRDFPLFGEQYYFVSFLGEPAADAPWMLQFGGHHLAINATVFGPDLSFSPMLTGGEPLHLAVDGQEVFITEAEVTAAQALMDSLDAAQRAQAIRSDEKINLLLGPGADGVAVLPEGIRGSDLTADQQALFLDLIGARLGFINDDDFAAKMEMARAELDQTHFGWWGPVGAPGTAYYRVTGPSLVIEYAPQDGGNSSDHAHNMYRDPSNDYGQAWIAE